MTDDTSQRLREELERNHWHNQLFDLAHDAGDEDELDLLLAQGDAAEALQGVLGSRVPVKANCVVLFRSRNDTDHIEGVVRLLNDFTLELEFGDIWFNGWDQLTDVLGPVEGEFLSALIKTGKLPWNRAFEGAAVMVPEDGALPACELDGGLKLTLLSPRRSELTRLRDVWLEAVTGAGMAPVKPRQALALLKQAKKLRPAAPDLLGGAEAEDLQRSADEPSRRDRKEANASSIVVLAEYQEGGEAKSCLFAADGVPGVLEETVPRLLRERQLQRLDLDAFKLPTTAARTTRARPAHPGKGSPGRPLISTNPQLAGGQPRQPHLGGCSGAVAADLDTTARLAITRATRRQILGHSLLL